MGKVYAFSLKEGLVVDGEAGFELAPFDVVEVRRSPGYRPQRQVVLDGEVVFTGNSIAAAIAIHNIPEGIAVSIPVYYATGDRRKAFRLSLLSGLAEPVGALLAYLVLMPFMSPTLMGCILAGVAGIMVFISIDELLPAAREYGEAHISIYGVVAGMALMAVSLIMLA